MGRNMGAILEKSTPTINLVNKIAYSLYFDKLFDVSARRYTEYGKL
jgi:hypothetical protein